jgi:hypothetical protein
MVKFKIECDPNARQFCSTRIIVDNVNRAADKLGLYSDISKVVLYDTLCNSHGFRRIDAFWCAFELPFPAIIQSNAGGKPILGLSKQNALFAAYGGYPRNLVNYVSLGVDSNLWKPTKKIYNLDKFVFLAFCESNNRSGFEDLVETFGDAYSGGTKKVQLYIKDREATSKFKEWVRERAEFWKVDIVHDDRHLEDHNEEIKLIQGADVGVCVNHSHTFGMVMSQAMACGLPQILIPYSGPGDYADKMNSFIPEYRIEEVTQEMINKLSEIGMKNYLFPIDNINYPGQPFWARVDHESLRQKMDEAMFHPKKLQQLSEICVLTARWMTWERTAINMSYVLSQLETQEEDLNLVLSRNRS